MQSAIQLRHLYSDDHRVIVITVLFNQANLLKLLNLLELLLQRQLLLHIVQLLKRCGGIHDLLLRSSLLFI